MSLHIAHFATGKKARPPGPRPRRGDELHGEPPLGRRARTRQHDCGPVGAPYGEIVQGQAQGDSQRADVRRRRFPSVAPILVVGAFAVVAAGAFAVLAFNVPGPEVFGDEMFYMEAATSLAHGHGLHVREGGYGFGPGFPLVAAIVLRAIADRVVAYHAVLALNGVVVASAVVPIYLIARRVLSVRAAAATAAVCLLMPCSFYAASFMTESLGYVAALWALAAILPAVERPTVARQIAVLAAVALASAIRPQFVVLLPTFLLALALRQLLEPKPRPPAGAAVRRLWPVWAALALSALAAAALAARSGSPARVMGGYSALWRSYDAIGSVEWAAWHAFDLALYLSLIPVVALPAMVAWAGRLARTSVEQRSFLALFAAANVVAIAMAGVFGSSEFGEGRLHDRYIFYVIPLWIVLLVGWACAGAPRTRVGVFAGGLVVLGLVALAPVGRLVRFNGTWLFDGAGTTTWAVVRELSGSQNVTKLLMAVAVCAAVVLVARVPAGRASLLVVLVAVGFLVPSWGMWARAMSVGDRNIFATRSRQQLLWVDDATAGARTVVLFVGSAACRDPAVEYAYIQSEFFNASIGPVAVLGPEGMSRFGLPELRATLGETGEVLKDGAPLSAAYVLTAPGVSIEGRIVARGTTAGLVLWQVGGPVRVRATGAEQVLAEACRREA